MLTYATLPDAMKGENLGYKLPSEHVVVYGLYDPTTGALRYIGKTAQRLGRRIQAHRHRASVDRTRTHCDNWLRSINCAPLVGVLGLFTADEWDAAERSWIADARNAGAQLTNATPGGEGYAGWHHTDEARARISVGVKGRRLTAEQTKRRVATRKVSYIKHSDATRARISAALARDVAVMHMCLHCPRSFRGRLGLGVHISKVHK